MIESDHPDIEVTIRCWESYRQHYNDANKTDTQEPLKPWSELTPAVKQHWLVQMNPFVKEWEAITRGL